MKDPQMSHKYILVGRSGTGKSTMAACLEELGRKRCITCTTRPPRPGELDKQEYYFLESADSFKMMRMFEQSEFGGHHYGVSMDELRKGDFIILEPKGVEFFRKNYPGPLTVIELQRNGIDVDPERRARDAAAGFDDIAPDITVYGETIEEMKQNLTAGILSFEMRRQRESYECYLPAAAPLEEVWGHVRLHFEDKQFGLPVTAEQRHVAFETDSEGYDGAYCFDSANYDRLFAVFCSLAEKRKDCTLELRIHDNNDTTLYSCRLTSSLGKVSGALQPEYLRMEPYHFVTKTPSEAVCLAYGGFLAAETDCTGFDHLYAESRKLVQRYRAFISYGRFEMHADSGGARHTSLDGQILQAQTANKKQSVKCNDSKSHKPHSYHR